MYEYPYPPKIMKMHKKMKSHCSILFFVIAFIFLLLAIVLPFVFKERVFINNSVFNGLEVESYLADSGVDMNTANKAALQNFRNYYKDYVRTFAIGIIHTCVTTEINYHGGKTYGGVYPYSSGGNSNTNSNPSTSVYYPPKVVLGTVCELTPWSLDLHKYGYIKSDFEDIIYASSVVNGTIIFEVNDTSASAAPGAPGAPGFPPVGFPNAPGNTGGDSSSTWNPCYWATLAEGNGVGSGSGKCHYPVYNSQGVSQFFKNVNFHTFNALRILALLALVISVVILVILAILCILHCLHPHHKKHRVLLKILFWLFWILKIVWIIVLILLVVVYHEIIRDLFNQSKALSIFAIGVSFWFFWIGFIFAVVVITIIFFHLKMHKKHKPPHHPCPPPHPHPCYPHLASSMTVEMASPSSYPGMPMSSPSAPTAAGANNHYV